MFAELLERLSVGLDQAGLPYMIIGGQAVLVHGEPRLTRDVDVTLGVDLDRLPELLAAVKQIDLEPLVDPESFTRTTMVLPCRDQRTSIRVDLILSHSRYEREALERAVVVRLGDAGVRFASVEDLVIHKMVAGRPRDLEDVRSLLLRNRGIDQALIENALDDFSRAMDEPLLASFRAIAREVKGAD